MRVSVSDIFVRQNLNCVTPEQDIALKLLTRAPQGYNCLIWSVATTDEFDMWFADLDEDGQAEIIAKVELLKLLGPRLSRPHADTLKGSKHANMKELRADTSDKVMRVAFAFDPERQAILLVAGGVRDLDGLLAVRELGVTRCGASRTKDMLDDRRRRLNFPAIATPEVKIVTGY